MSNLLFSIGIPVIFVCLILGPALFLLALGAVLFGTPGPAAGWAVIIGAALVVIGGVALAGLMLRRRQER